MSKMRNIAAILGRTEATNVDNSPGVDIDDNIADSSVVNSILAGSTMAVFSSVDSLPGSPTAGSQAFVTGNQRLYTARNSAVGSGWYNVALINATPTLSLSSSGTIALTAGSATTITMTALDSDNSNANLTLSLESGGDLFKFATVSRDSSVVTITPRTEDSATTLGSDGSATLTFKASDGISQATVQNTFTLSFGPDWSATPTKTKIITGPRASALYGLGSVCTNSDGTYVGARDHNIPGGNNYEIWYKSGGSWSKQATLNPTGGNGPANNYQSAGMSDDADYLVLGDQNSAKAFVYYRTGTSWALQQTITCPIANEADFGWSCDMSGDGNYFIVSDRSSTSSDYGGQAWVYKRSGTSWSVEQQLTQPSSSSNYGYSVCIDKTGTYAFVGDWAYNSDTGRGYIWTRSGTTWTLQQTIAGSTTASGDRFGSVSAISGNGEHLAINAPYDDDGATSSGTVFMFSRSGTTWTQRAAITPGANANGVTGEYGIGIDDAGENVVFSHTISSVKTMFVYSRSGNTWSQTRQLAGIDGAEQYTNGMTGGRAMSGDGKVIFSGAYYNNDGSNVGAGGVYEFVSG